MARGYSHAPGASAEVIAALDPARTKAELLHLGASKNAVVRAAVGSRPDCPLGLMVTLAHDYAVEVRCAVAANVHAQRSVMQYLAADKSIDVVLTLVDNAALPEDLVDELAFHKKAKVREAVAARIDTGTPLAQGERPSPSLMDVADRFATQEVQRMLREQAPPVAELAATTPAAPEPASPEPSVEPGDDHLASPVFHATSHLGTRTAPVRGFRPPRVNDAL